MGKITKMTPKPLIKVGSKPIIEHKIKYYFSQELKILFIVLVINHIF